MKIHKILYNDKIYKVRYFYKDSATKETKAVCNTDELDGEFGDEILTEKVTLVA